MPLIKYQEVKFSEEKMKLVEHARSILTEYMNQGYELTLRALYYKFVSRELLPRSWRMKMVGGRLVPHPDGSENNERSYKKLGAIIVDARMAGLLDWDHISDITRNLKGNSHWDSPADIVEVCSRQYQINKWEDQPHHIEVWVEKDGLLAILDPICRPLDISFFSCRGYTSISEIWSASQRLLRHLASGKQVTVLHLGDHDPSGVDMSRDIADRLVLFIKHHRSKLAQNFHVERLALNMNQVREYDPPPNPAKMSDSRAQKYVEEYGDESWELDALEPTVLRTLITDAVMERRDVDLWAEAADREDREKQQLVKVSENWEAIVERLEEDV